MSKFITEPGALPWIIKSPGARLDYSEPWGSWMKAGDSIVGVAVVIANASGAAIGAGDLVDAGHSTGTGSVVTVWLTGGILGQVYTVAITITTAAGRVDTRTFEVRIVTR